MTCNMWSSSIYLVFIFFILGNCCDRHFFTFYPPPPLTHIHTRKTRRGEGGGTFCIVLMLNQPGLICTKNLELVIKIITNIIIKIISLEVVEQRSVKLYRSKYVSNLTFGSFVSNESTYRYRIKVDFSNKKYIRGNS